MSTQTSTATNLSSEDLFALSSDEFDLLLQNQPTAVLQDLKRGLKEEYAERRTAEMCFSTQERKRRWLATCKAAACGKEEVMFSLAIEIFDQLCSECRFAREWLLSVIQNWIKDDHRKLARFLRRIVSVDWTFSWRCDSLLIELFLGLDDPSTMTSLPLSVLLFWTFHLKYFGTNNFITLSVREKHSLIVDAKLAWRLCDFQTQGEESYCYFGSRWRLGMESAEQVKKLSWADKVLFFCQAQYDVLCLATGKIGFDSVKGIELKKRIELAIKYYQFHRDTHEACVLEMFLPLETIPPQQPCSIATILFVWKVLYNVNSLTTVLQELLDSRFFAFWFLDTRGFQKQYFYDIRDICRLYENPCLTLEERRKDWRMCMKDCFFEWIYSGKFIEMARELGSDFDLVQHFLDYFPKHIDARDCVVLEEETTKQLFGFLSPDTLNMLEFFSCTAMRKRRSFPAVSCGVQTQNFFVCPSNQSTANQHVSRPFNDLIKQPNRESLLERSVFFRAVDHLLKNDLNYSWRHGYRVWLHYFLKSDAGLHKHWFFNTTIHAMFQLFFFVEFDVAKRILVDELRFSETFVGFMMTTMLLNARAIFSKFGENGVYVRKLKDNLRAWTVHVARDRNDELFLNFLRTSNQNSMYFVCQFHSVYSNHSSDCIADFSQGELVIETVWRFYNDCCLSDDVWEWAFSGFRRTYFEDNWLPYAVRRAIMLLKSSNRPMKFPLSVFLSELQRLGCFPPPDEVDVKITNTLSCFQVTNGPFKTMLVDVFLHCYDTMSALVDVAQVLEDNSTFVTEQAPSSAIIVIRDIVVREFLVFCRQRSRLLYTEYEKTISVLSEEEE